MTCFACEREPTQQCSRCGRPYCDEHGEELCDICLQPASGVPSFGLYRGSLLALLVGTALAVWLLVQPSNSESTGANRPILVTPTASTAQAQTPGPVATQPATNTTPPANTTPGGSTTPAATGTIRPTGTVSPVASGTPAAGAGSYTVASGDTLSGICSSQRPALSNTDCVAQIRTLNNIIGDNLSIGQVLRLP